MALKRALKHVLVGSFALSTVVWADGPSPQMLSQTCAACHGPGGSSVGVTPSIAGADPVYFIDTMKAFKSGERHATVMDRVAKGYSDGDIEKMAHYFAAQPMRPMKQTYASDKAKLGARLHKDYCDRCHEDGGTNPEDSAPLAGQSMLYLTFSMEDFKAGHREAPKKMKRKVQEMLEEHGDAAVEAVIHYYGSKR